MDREIFQAFLGQEFWAAWEGALPGKTLVGYCSAIQKRNLVWIRRIGVSAQYRRRGIGRLLLEQVLNHFSNTGQGEVILYVMQDNLPALRLYEKFGFNIVETSYQYVWRLGEFKSKDSRIIFRPIDEVTEAEMPELPEQWADLREQHHPPRQYVLIFFDESGNNAGYCRLSPGFPGCSPFVVRKADVNLLPVLDGLRKYLLPEKDHIKLTFNDEGIAQACEKHGIGLNYKLYKMVKTL